jgi:hypothetical protein
MKTSPTILALLLSSSLTAQPFLGATGTNHGVGVQTGALIKIEPGEEVKRRLDVTIGFVTRLVQDPEKPIMFYSHAGYMLPIGETKIGYRFFFTPAIGYSITQWEDKTHTPPEQEGKPVKKGRIFPHVEFAAQGRNIRLFTTFTYSNFFYAAIGIKGYIVFDSDGPTRRKVY